MSQPKYRYGERVRVRPGERCQATGDVTYGGWDGRIELVEEHEHGFAYQLFWSDETLAGLHRLHDEIWWREQVDDYGLWFREEQLEPRTGNPPPRESLSEEFIREFESRDARIAIALGLGGAEIPFPDEETLESYYRHLAERLEFPFEAQVETVEGSGPAEEQDEIDGPDDALDERAADFVEGGNETVVRDVTVLLLVPLDDEDDDLPLEGLLCRTLEQNRPWDVPLADVRVKDDGPNRQLLADYGYWFNTWSQIEDNYDAPYEEADDEEYDHDPDEDGDAYDDELDEDDRDENGELHVEDFLDASARTASEARTLDSPGPITRDNPRVGRNDLCPCGSGKKFKKCCLNNPAPPNPPPAPSS